MNATKYYTEQTQELIKFGSEIGFGSLPLLLNNSFATLRKKFAENCIGFEYQEQIKNLKTLNAKDYIEVEGLEDIEEGTDDIGFFRCEYHLTHPTDNDRVISVMVSIPFHVVENDEFDEPTQTLIMPHFADVTLDDNETRTTTEIQDINTNELAYMLKGMSVQLQIDNTVVNGNTFVYDGCHKIYVIADVQDRLTARDYGYIVDGSNADDEIEHPISEIETYYNDSCPLRFIQYMDVERADYNILPQGSENPMFIYY